MPTITPAADQSIPEVPSCARKSSINQQSQVDIFKCNILSIYPRHNFLIIYELKINVVMLSDGESLSTTFNLQPHDQYTASPTEHRMDFHIRTQPAHKWKVYYL